MISSLNLSHFCSTINVDLRVCLQEYSHFGVIIIKQYFIVLYTTNNFALPEP